jgi:nicotinamidase-related amidase
MTPMGEEMSPRLKAKRAERFSSSRRDLGYDIDSRLAPAENDLVIDKLTSGAFTMTPLDHALRNMGVRTIVVTGILTDMCILGTARVGAELGYNSIIVEDATATFTQRAQNEALAVHARVFGRVMTSDEVMVDVGG